MTELLTAAQMRAIEQAAIEGGEVTGLELMERAGRGVVEAVFEEWPELAKTSHRAVVLCGPGNNGGDGFVVARLLKEWGWEVEVFLYGDAGKLPPDARVNYERWEKVGIVLGWDEPAIEYALLSEKSTLSVDAMFGSGLSRELPYGSTHEISTAFVFRVYTDEAPSVAVDIASGLSANGGKILGDVFAANLTVTFHKPKIGHFLNEGAGVSGKIAVVGIGLGKRWMRSAPKLIQECSGNLGKNSAQEHKFSHGHALILTGAPGKTGAARLSARGALRIGAGVVTLGVPPSAQMEVVGHITAVMLARVADGDALAEMLQDSRINALCLGPGLGLDRARELVPVACGGVKPRPTVLDADALSAYADDPEVLFAMLHDACVLTPHAGEFARLFPDIAKRLCKEPRSGPAYSKVDATRDAAKRAGCVVLFKGADTVIAAPDGRCSINSAHYERAAPWLATAGSGDVLAGFITGLMARGFAPFQAAETAAWLHVECALEFGPGLIAEDIPEVLPKVFRTLGL